MVCVCVRGVGGGGGGFFSEELDAIHALYATNISGVSKPRHTVTKITSL